MLLADAPEGRPAGLVVEGAHRIRAQEQEAADLREIVPEISEHDRRLGGAALPQRRGHLAVDAHLARATQRRAIEDLDDRVAKARRVRTPAGHEALERLGGIEFDEAPLADGRDDIETRTARYRPVVRCAAPRE
jgi:hypothetical protein